MQLKKVIASLVLYSLVSASPAFSAVAHAVAHWNHSIHEHSHRGHTHKHAHSSDHHELNVVSVPTAHVPQPFVLSSPLSKRFVVDHSFEPVPQAVMSIHRSDRQGKDPPPPVHQPGFRHSLTNKAPPA